ncbi:PIG-L family deacetylase [Streptomyces sp. NPDC050548]|uniref:PIG-L family deacetylase n=1 Tax=Streptomyces sp. NPDC050548 TaxID=3365629 RepID=UPI0037886F31
MTGPGAGGAGLPDDLRRVPAVVAHPDDESFGLGGLLALLSARGVPTTVLCFTHGEASTLHAGPGDLRMLRRTNWPAPHGNWAWNDAWSRPRIRTANSPPSR